MHPDFWHQRWHDHQIGFHQDAPTPLLLQHWPALDLPAGSCVFVPLAGKSHDMTWLAAQGHRVLGVELSQQAVEAFFAEHDLHPQRHDSPYGAHYTAAGVELICGDAFALDAAALADCSAVFDRAALIALPPAMRQRYVGELYARLPPACRGLLITLEYPQPEKAGPPFLGAGSRSACVVRARLGYHHARTPRHPRQPAGFHRGRRERIGDGGVSP